MGSSVPEGDADTCWAAAKARTAVTGSSCEHGQASADPKALGQRQRLSGPVRQFQSGTEMEPPSFPGRRPRRPPWPG